MFTVKRTSDIRTARGLVDFKADGLIAIGKDENIPCEIGYYELEDPDGETILRAEYLFIKRDGFTELGNAFHKETIKLDNNINYLVMDEEV